MKRSTSGLDWVGIRYGASDSNRNRTQEANVEIRHWRSASHNLKGLLRVDGLSDKGLLGATEFQRQSSGVELGNVYFGPRPCAASRFGHLLTFRVIDDLLVLND